MVSCHSIDRRAVLTLLGSAATIPVLRTPVQAQSETMIRVANIPFEASAQLFYAKRARTSIPAQELTIVGFDHVVELGTRTFGITSLVKRFSEDIASLRVMLPNIM